MRCCRCCTCMACPRWTSCRRWAVPGLHGWAVRAGDHEADRDLEGRGVCLLAAGPVWGGLRLPVGRRHPCQYPPRGTQVVRSVCVPTAVRSSSRWPTGTGSPPNARRICCALPRGAGCAPRCSRSVTARGNWGQHEHYCKGTYERHLTGRMVQIGRAGSS
jgi:hypothetical protein